MTIELDKIYRIKGESKYFLRKYRSSNPLICVQETINVTEKGYNPPGFLFLGRVYAEGLPTAPAVYGYIKSGSGKSGNKPQGKCSSNPECVGDLEDDIRAGPCVSSKTIGWKPACKCQTDKPPVPAIVLDPFAGSGTTLQVAAELGRRSIGYELSSEYCKLIIERNKQDVLV